jgi:nitronate monooxygenase
MTVRHSSSERSLATAFTARFGVEHPIIQAGMGEAGPELAAAVSNAGALGSLGTIGKSPGQVADQVAETRRLTDRPFAVNVVTFDWAPFWGEMVGAAVDAGASIVTLSFGDPTPAMERCKAAGVKTIIQVQNLQLARRALALKPDLLVTQGNEAGGHTGTRGTLSFAAQALDLAGETPVAVAGGIASGRGLAAVLAMGAAAAVVGTRFKATAEYPIAQYQKDQIVASDGSNTTDDELNDAAYGLPWPAGVVGRAVKNAFQAEWEGRAEELRALVASQPPFQFVGELAGKQASVNWAGESAGLVKAVQPAAEVVAEIVRDAGALLGRWAAAGSRS